MYGDSLIPNTDPQCLGMRLVLGGWAFCSYFTVNGYSLYGLPLEDLGVLLAVIEDWPIFLNHQSV